MKTRNSFAMFALLFCSSAIADNQPIFKSEDPNVKNIEVTAEGAYKITCADNSAGLAANEEGQICVFSQENNKNFCNSSTSWSWQDAFSYLCSAPVNQTISF